MALHLPLFDWDELNFIETSREMVRTGNYLQPTVNYLPFHEKPPLFHWLQAFFLHLTDNFRVAARLPNLLFGLLTLDGLYRVGRRWRGSEFGLTWAVLMAASFLPQLYFSTGIIDPVFNYFVFWAVVGLLENRLVLSSAALGLALLTKGPAAGLLVGLWCLVALLRGGVAGAGVKRYTLVGVGALLLFGLWLAALWQRDGGYFATEFLRYQWRLFSREDAGHGGFPGYHFVVVLLGCFPASFYALRALFDPVAYWEHEDRGMRWLFWIVMIVFTVVSTKIVHYSSLAYFPVTYFAARYVGAVGELSVRGQKWVRIYLLPCVTALLLLPLLGRFDHLLADWITDPELSSRLRLPVHWPIYTFLPGLVLLLTLLANRRVVRLPVLLLGCTLTLTLTAGLLLPRLITYNQGALTTFYGTLAGRDVYVGTAYHKSYAPEFHARLPPERGARERHWRFHGPIDRPLYFSAPLRHRERVLREVPDAVVVDSLGGYLFLRRE